MHLLEENRRSGQEKGKEDAQLQPLPIWEKPSVQLLHGILLTLCWNSPYQLKANLPSGTRCWTAADSWPNQSQGEEENDYFYPGSRSIWPTMYFRAGSICSTSETICSRWTFGHYDPLFSFNCWLDLHLYKLLKLMEQDWRRNTISPGHTFTTSKDIPLLSFPLIHLHFIFHSLVDSLQLLQGSTEIGQKGKTNKLWPWGKRKYLIGMQKSQVQSLVSPVKRIR